MQRLIGPRGKHIRDIVAFWITGRGSRSWEDDEGPLRRVSGSGEMNEIGYWFSTQLSVPLSRTWRMSTQVSSLERTLSVVFWKGLCFFAMALLVSGIILVWIMGPRHVPSSLSTAVDLTTSPSPSARASQPPTTFAAPKMVCVFRSMQAIFLEELR